MKRRGLLKLAVFLLLGAAVNVAVAWAGASGWNQYIDSTGRALTAEELAWIAAYQEQISAWPYGPEFEMSWGCERRDVALADSAFEAKWRPMWEGDGWASRPRYVASRVQAGWPMRSMRGSHVTHTTDWWNAHPAKRQREWSGVLWMRDSGRPLPVQPIWPAFTANTLFYAALLWVCWLLFAAPMAVRRFVGRRRIKRGLCPACAYPVGASDVCTECGKPVTTPKHKAQIEKAQIT